MIPLPATPSTPSLDTAGAARRRTRPLSPAVAPTDLQRKRPGGPDPLPSRRPHRTPTAADPTTDTQPPSRGRRTSTSTQHDWAQHLERAGRHLRDHGHLNRAGENTRTWADQQIRALRAGRLDPTAAGQLRDAGITADTPTSRELEQQRSWTVFLTEFDWWVAKHGHGRVPQNATSRKVDGVPYPLGRRVAKHRHNHTKGLLTDAQAQDLDDRPAWIRNTYHDHWEHRYTQLAAHVATKRPLTQLERPLALWLRDQRTNLDQLDPQRRQRLQKIPGALDRDLRSKVPEFVAAARTWLKRHPGQTMTALQDRDTLTINGEHIRLGHKATYYRRRYHHLEGTHPLTPTDITHIETLPGWKWNTLSPTVAGDQ